MSTPALVTHTLTVRGLDADAIRTAMIAALEADGYTVTLEPVWEQPQAMAARLGVRPASLTRMLGYTHAPKARHEQRSDHGRLIRLVSTPELDAYVTRARRGPQKL